VLKKTPFTQAISYPPLLGKLNALSLTNVTASTQSINIEGNSSDTNRHPHRVNLYHIGWQNLLPADFFIQKEIHMVKLFKRFMREEEGQDFAEYALILGAVGVVAIAVISQYKTELIAAFQAGIDALRMARGG
jgi:Flp pilus assembly pilin Flp